MRETSETYIDEEIPRQVSQMANSVADQAYIDKALVDQFAQLCYQNMNQLPTSTNKSAPRKLFRRNTRWNAAELGFFDPTYKGKTVQTGPDMEHTNRETYFRDVHMFIQRAKDFMPAKGEVVIRENLFTCLRGIALQWYTSELASDTKRLLRHGAGIEEWERLLLKRFKQSLSMAMDMLANEKYTMEDACECREPREYSAKIIRAARDADMAAELNIMSLIYNGFDVEFRRDLLIPSTSLALDTFLQTMDDRKHLWWELAARNNSYIMPSRNNSLSRNVNRSEKSYYDPNQIRGWQNYNDDGHYAPRGQSFDHLSSSVPANALKQLEFPRQNLPLPPIRRQPLAITAPPAADTQDWQRNKDQQEKYETWRAYRTYDQDEDVEVDDEGEYYPEESQDSSFTEEYKSEEKIAEKICSHCHQTFQSKNKLHAHLRNGCPNKRLAFKSSSSMQSAMPYPKYPPRIIQSRVDTPRLNGGDGSRYWK